MNSRLFFFGSSRNIRILTSGWLWLKIHIVRMDRQETHTNI
jgi:hypothetical protein